MKTIAWMMVVIMGLLGCLPSVQAANPVSVSVAVTADEAAALEAGEQESLLSQRAGDDGSANVVMGAIIIGAFFLYYLSTLDS